METMMRKDYQIPTMNIVQLQHTGILMTSGDPASAGSKSSINGWGDGGSNTENIVM